MRKQSWVRNGRAGVKTQGQDNTNRNTCNAGRERAGERVQCAGLSMYCLSTASNDPMRKQVCSPVVSLQQGVHTQDVKDNLLGCKEKILNILFTYFTKKH